MSDVNLKAMLTIGEYFGVKFGYSDHTLGIEASILSLGYNIDYIEKHFTVDNDLPGRDNKFAILPNQLKKLRTTLKYDKIYFKKFFKFKR